MFKRTVAYFLVTSLILIYTAGCGKKRNAYDRNLNDLGGVFALNLDDINFNEEISGRLSEGGSYNDSSEVAVISYDISVNGQYSDKILRWGILRKPNHQIPSADPGAPELLAKYGGIYLGDITRKVIYLTFDEGYENGYTPKILDVLKQNNAKAVFFITGPYLKEHMDLVERMVNEGHEVGNHTVHHPSLPELSSEEIEEEVLGLDRAFYEKFGKHMKFLRPPKGEYSENTLAITHKLGYCNMFWSFAYDDWYRDRIRGADYAYEKVINNLHNGAIILLHAVSRDNAEALDRIIKKAREMGYEIGDVNDIKIPGS